MPCAFAARLPVYGSASPSSCWWLVTRAPWRPLWRPLCQVFRKIKRVSWPTSPFHLSPRRPRPPIPPRPCQPQPTPPPRYPHRRTPPPRYPRRRIDPGQHGPCQPTPCHPCPRPPIPPHPCPLRPLTLPPHLRLLDLSRQSPPQAPAPPLRLRCHHPPDRRCLGPRQPCSLPLPPRPNERTSL